MCEKEQFCLFLCNEIIKKKRNEVINFCNYFSFETKTVPYFRPTTTTFIRSTFLIRWHKNNLSELIISIHC